MWNKWDNLKVYILHLKVKKAIFFSRANFLSGWIEKQQLYDESKKKKKKDCFHGVKENAKWNNRH